MKITIKTLATVAIFLAASPAIAEEKLRVANWAPTSHTLYTDVMQPFARSIEEATEGRVKVDILPAPLGPPPAHFDFAVNGIADITFGVQAYTPGRFKTSSIAEAPFLGDSAEAISVAYWRTYEEHLAQAGEYDQVKVLSLFVHGPGGLFVRGRDATKLEDLDGAKLRVSGGIAHEVTSALGMVPVEASAPQSYELLSQGVVDGIMFPYESVQFFNLNALVDTALIVPGGLYNTSFFVVMNKTRWESLSAADQTAIESVAGEVLARLAGRAFDRADEAARSAVNAHVKTAIVGGVDLERLQDRLSPVIEDRNAKLKAAGISSRAAVQMMQAEIESLSGQ
ncbi:TRAP transporter substrate-binding protein [Sulfitobacter sp. F26204]|uniref:TRAP transporter substrate-binding protein n=1 Tax=Sulfitobacter sp. F26204 TaxID=2996014 RepID=UPI00225E3646|nr:TRAP transporter substrate-binding protein [Sulfitobacter sp. F26204]MCX7561725.1 TRAP transporter substrate-binding protein [Sulfitobacter sp. F26204]